MIRPARSFYVLKGVLLWKKRSSAIGPCSCAHPAGLYHRLYLAVYLGRGAFVLQIHNCQNVTFVGLGNYAKIWLDDTFTHAFWFTAVFTVVSTVLINVLAFGIALLLTRGIRGTNIFRTTFFMPNLIGGIILGYIWQILLNGVLSATS